MVPSPTLKHAVALSGGPDSLCAAAHMPPGMAFIVDHGLRLGSDQEARRAASQAEELGHQPEILTWSHVEIPKTQAAYRAGRYALLAQACQRYGIDHLWTGHQADDQAETLLLRMSMGSGLIGLSGMAQRTWLGNTRLYRPLITIPKVDILAWLKKRQLTCLKDPSNDDPAYPRVAWRGALALRPDVRKQLFAISKQMGQLRNNVLQQIPPGLVRPLAPGILTIDAQVGGLSQASVHETLAACIRWIGGRVFAPLDQAIDFVCNPPRSRARLAVGGALISWRRDMEVFTLVPEMRPQPPPQRTGDLDPALDFSGEADMDLIRLAAPKLATRRKETCDGLWMPGNQVKFGGLIMGIQPRFDHVYATNLPNFFLKD